MATTTSNQNIGHRSLAVLAAVALLSLTLAACGPVYVQTADDGYYRNRNPAAAPVAQPAPLQPAPAPVAPAQPVSTNPCANWAPTYQGLSAWGVWMYLPEHGCVWVPDANQQPGWRPYYIGYWDYTNWGWTWVSSEPFGWAAYHYGRWFWHGEWGWTWKPGYEWAPAWVSWRQGGGCVGWAPLGPGGHSHSNHAYWVFVRHQHFRSHNIASVIVRPEVSSTIYTRTSIIGGSSPARSSARTPYYRGPPPTTVRTWTRTTVTPTQVDDIPSARPRPVPAAAPPRPPPPRATHPAPRPAASHPAPRPAPPAAGVSAAPPRRPPVDPPAPPVRDTGTRPMPGTSARPGPGVTPVDPRGDPGPVRVLPHGNDPRNDPRQARPAPPDARPDVRPAPPAQRPEARPAPARMEPPPNRPVRPAPPEARPAPTRPDVRPDARPAPPRPDARPAPPRPDARPAPPRPDARPAPPRPGARPAPARRPPAARPAPPTTRPGTAPPSVDSRVNPNPVKPGDAKKKPPTRRDPREIEVERPRGVPSPHPVPGRAGRTTRDR